MHDTNNNKKRKENKNWKQNTQIIHIVRGQEDTYV